MAVCTQWRSGFGGRTGLDYSACMATLKLKLPRWRRQSNAFCELSLDDLHEDLQIVESAILRADSDMHEVEEQARGTPT